MKHFVLAAALPASLAAAAHAAPEAYVLDPSHSQILFSYDHMGFSTTYGLFGGIEGRISFDAAAPAGSSVSVSFPIENLLTGWQERDAHFLSPELFNATANKDVTFKSTAIEVTGEKTGKITGELTINGVTKPVVLEAAMTQMGEHPMAKKPWVGFNATTTVKRSDFGLTEVLGLVSDEIVIDITTEAVEAKALAAALKAMAETK